MIFIGLQVIYNSKKRLSKSNIDAAWVKLNAIQEQFSEWVRGDPSDSDPKHLTELLVEKECPSSKYEGKIKKYKALTSKGLAYGINKENPSSPGRTTPDYYVEHFNELFSLIQKEVSKWNNI